MRVPALRVLAAASLASVGLAVTMVPPALADGPGSGAPVVVAMGDSYISGEAGRWAGNTGTSYRNVDALGSTAYYDNPDHSAETIALCHRSSSDEAYLGSGIAGKVLACSGARTTTSAGSDPFKPGIDFYDDGKGHQGQALLLRQVAATSNVKLVVLSIGGNDFNFASIVQACVTDFLLSPSWWPNYCNDDASVRANFTAANVAAITTRIAEAIRNVRTAMSTAGYSDGAYTLLLQTYPSPIPAGAGFRYSQKGFTRQTTGGCGFWNSDADWANATALPTINGAVRNAVALVGAANVKLLDLTDAFNGRRLCESTVGSLEEAGLSTWRSAGAVDKTEWIDRIRTVSAIGTPYFIQESLHPNYWAQLATRSCVRQAYNGGAPKGGSCRIGGTGLTATGEPVMVLNP